MWLTSSSIGRKFVMALTGCALVLFVTFHCLMNTVAIFWPAAYNEICMFLGANWYALIASAGLAVLIIIHIVYAIWLTIQNRAARGEDRYEVTAMPPHVEWSSKNMLVLGIVILAFLGVHLIQFWAKMQLQEIMGTHAVADGVALPPEFGTLFLQQAFSTPWTAIVYIIGFVALWFHMTHGFWSMFHTVGWDNNIWINRLKCIGNAWTTIVVLLFVCQAIAFTGYAYAGKIANGLVEEAEAKVANGQADAAYLADAEATAAKLQKWAHFLNDPACQAQYAEYWDNQAEKLNTTVIEAVNAAQAAHPDMFYSKDAFNEYCKPIFDKYMEQYEHLLAAVKAQCPEAQSQNLQQTSGLLNEMKHIQGQFDDNAGIINAYN